MQYVTKMKWWLLWCALTCAGGTYFLYLFNYADDKRSLLPGETTVGHYQIELACSACHTPFMGVKQDACVGCHGKELDASHDSHPESKFSDPGNIHMLDKIEANRCTACHREHDPKVTHPMGVSVPDNYCMFCHEDIAVERPSHEGYGFETCSTTGCHNFHDNRSLYEGFLSKHLDEPAILPDPKVPAASTPRKLGEPLTVDAHDAPDGGAVDQTILTEWADTVHAASGVNCTGCHTSADDNSWLDKPTAENCSECHAEAVTGFGEGRHGMRVAAGLSPMTPALARLSMHQDALHRELSCTACHGSHQFDVTYAAADACMKCHADEHTMAYKHSSHYELWKLELEGKGDKGTGVSCATCHMPRTVGREDGAAVTRVQHNQNDNLRPSDKMIRSACMNCHGVEFSLNALADRKGALANFPGAPSKKLETMAWVKAREILKMKRRSPKGKPEKRGE